MIENITPGRPYKGERDEEASDGSEESGDISSEEDDLEQLNNPGVKIIGRKTPVLQVTEEQLEKFTLKILGNGKKKKIS